jgi:hypothetical protein
LSIEKKWGDVPESNCVVVRADGCDNALVTMSSSHIAQDVAMQLVLELLIVLGQIIGVDKIARLSPVSSPLHETLYTQTYHFINSKGLSQTQGSAFIFFNAENADLLLLAFERQTAFLLKSNSSGS